MRGLMIPVRWSRRVIPGLDRIDECELLRCPSDFFQRRCNWQIRLHVEGEEFRVAVVGLAGSYSALRLCQLDCGHCGH